jgi:hypothetical protein
MAGGDEDTRSFPSEMWLYCRIEGPCPIENSQIEGSQNASFVGAFPIVGGFVPVKSVYASVIRFISPLYVKKDKR